MSIQLIVFPQYYDGQYSTISTNTNEFIVDGTSFNTIDTSSSYDTSTTITFPSIFNNAPPSIVNTWYRFRTTNSGTPALPTVSSGALRLASASTLSMSGVYQKVSNLNVGAQYNIKIDVSSAVAGGFIYVAAFNGNNYPSNITTLQTYSSSSTTVNHNFTADGSELTILISYVNTSNTTLSISSISVLPQGSTPSVEIANGQALLDLYEDENLPLTLSIDDFKNAAEQVQSYSKAFKVPATKRNNKIFDNIFEITRTQDNISFNPYVKTKCELKQDGFVLFEGYLRLIDMSDKEGEKSYNINLYSDVIALADVLGDKTFSDLDFTELEHDYTKNNIKASWTSGVTYLNSGTSGYRAADTVKYPFVDWNHQVSISQNTASTGPAYNMPELASLNSAFRPWLNIRYLIDRIFEDTDFSYTSEFFDLSDIKKLYMDFNWGSEDYPSLGDLTKFVGGYLYYSYGGVTGMGAVVANDSTYTTLKVGDVSPLGHPAPPPNYDTSTGVITSTVQNETYLIEYSFQIENSHGLLPYQYKCRWNYNGNYIDEMPTFQTLAAGTDTIWGGSFSIVMATAGDTLKPEFIASPSTGGSLSPTPIRQKQVASTFGQGTATVNFYTGVTTLTSNSFLQTLRGELGQWDFLKGLMTMFNLVAMPDKSNPNNVIIEPYQDIFISNSDSQEHDWTDKVDTTEIKLKPLTELNAKTVFKYVEDEDDYTFAQYKKSAQGFLYGSKTIDSTTTGNGLPTLLSGTKEIIAEPFAATVVKPIDPAYLDIVTPAIYSFNAEEGTSQGFDNSPRICYNNGVVNLPSGVTYYVPPENGGTSENLTQYLQFSHMTELPGTNSAADFNFGESSLFLGAGLAPPSNLFNNFWAPYFNELYNADTRVMTIKVNLTAGDINSFQWYDTVFIKNRTFRVNSIDYKPNELATVELILIP